MSEVAFVPARLRLARDLKKWSQTDLSGRVSVTAAAISQFESGSVRPSPATMDELSRVLNVPVTFFALPTTETHEGFFRSTRRTPVAHRRRARALAHIVHDLAIGAGVKHVPATAVPHIPIANLESPREEIEHAAVMVRSAWSVPAGPIPSVVELLESHGVVVLRLPLDTADVDAFSLPFPDWPVVVLGSDKNDRARSRFDGAHELGHLVMHGEQVWGLKEIEKQAHQFAAAFLMPANEIYHELPHRADWSVLFDLKRRWQVSLAALLMRARTLGRMTEPTYLTAVKALSAHGWRRVEPVPLGSLERPSLVGRIVAVQPQSYRQALPRHIVNAVVDAG